MICITAVLTAANIVLSMSIFSIPVPGGHLYLNDIVICTASILLGPACSFVVGGVGAFIGDMLFYPLPMFVSLAVHGLQAVAVSVISHKTFRKKPVLASALGVIVGAVIMVAGYTLGKIYVYSTFEYAMVKLPYEIMQASLGAVGGMLLCWKGGLKKYYDSHVLK